MDTKKVKESIELLRQELKEPRHQKALGHLIDAAQEIWTQATDREQKILKGEPELQPQSGTQ